MKFIALMIGTINRMILTLCLVVIIASALFIGYRGNQPMQVQGVPKGMTYFQFMGDRLDAAKVVRPARCGTGMIGSLFALGPFYAALYTHVAIHPKGFLARVTAPDPDMPEIVGKVAWYQIPDIWWNTFERLSWTMLAKRHPGCNLGPVAAKR